MGRNLSDPKERSMPGFDDDWRCCHDNTKGCPAGGCDSGCARDAGWIGRDVPPSSPPPHEWPEDRH